MSCDTLDAAGVIGDVLMKLAKGAKLHRIEQGSEYRGEGRGALAMCWRRGHDWIRRPSCSPWATSSPAGASTPAAPNGRLSAPDLIAAVYHAGRSWSRTSTLPSNASKVASTPLNARHVEPLLEPLLGGVPASPPVRQDM